MLWACTTCGACVQACPTATLVERKVAEIGTPDRSVVTTCAYCGVGCNLTVHEQDGKIVKVTSPLDHTVTHGTLCIKGRFGWQFVQIEPAASGGDSADRKADR